MTTKKELREAIARDLCLLSGYDPDGCDRSIIPPDAIIAEFKNWTIFQHDADRAIALTVKACVKACRTTVTESKASRSKEGFTVIHRPRTLIEAIDVMKSYLPDGVRIDENT